MSIFALGANIFYKYVQVLMEFSVFYKNVFSYFMKMYLNVSTCIKTYGNTLILEHNLFWLLEM